MICSLQVKMVKSSKKYGGSGSRRPHPKTLSKSSILSKKPTADVQRKQILELKRNQDGLKRKVNMRNMHGIFNKNHDVAVTSNYVHMQLLLPTSQPGESAMAQVFQTDSSILSRQTFLVKSIKCIYKVYPNNEEEPVDCTVTCIAPKSRKILNETYSPLTGALSLVQGTDYVINNGLTLVNKQRWTLHHYRRTMTVGQDGDLGTQFPIRSNSGSFTIKKDWKLYNRTGNFDDIPSNDLPAHQRVFLVVFNNNSGVDLEWPKFKHNTLIQGLVMD